MMQCLFMLIFTQLNILLTTEAKKHGFVSPFEYCRGNWREHDAKCWEKVTVNEAKVGAAMYNDPSKHIIAGMAYILLKLQITGWPTALWMAHSRILLFQSPMHVCNTKNDYGDRTQSHWFRRRGDLSIGPWSQFFGTFT